MANNADARIKITADAQEAISQMQALEKAAESLNKNMGSLRGKNKRSFDYSQDLKDLNAAIEGYAKAQKKMENVFGKELKSGLKTVTDDFETMNKAMTNARMNQRKFSKGFDTSAESSKKSTKQMVADIESLITAEGSLATLKKRQRELYNLSTDSFRKNAKEYEKALTLQQSYEDALASRERITQSGFLKRVKNSAAYITGYAGFNAVTAGVTAGLSAIRDYELGVTDLRRTLDASEASLANFGRAAVAAAKDFGVGISDAQEAMTELARAGVDEANLEGMTKNVLMGLNTTELKSASEVTSALVSTIKQMDMNWEDSGMILDSWNFLADKYAVQTDDFAHAIERSGAASKMLGMDLYDLNAVVTILGESTQASGEQVGTAFKSLSARLLRQGTIDKLKEFGIEVKKDEDHFLSFRDIMKNINEVIKDLPEDSPVLSDIMDTLGGAWRKNWITALAKDFDRFDGLVEEQAKSVGYSAKENEKAMDTISKKAETLKQTFLEGFIDIGEDGGFKNGIKDFLDGTTEAVDKFINSPSLRKVGKFLFGNPIKAAGFGAILSFFTKLSGASNPLMMISDLIVGKDLFGNMNRSLSSVLNTAKNSGSIFSGLFKNLSHFQAELSTKSGGNIGAGFKKWYEDKVGVSGKQKRAQKVYDEIRDSLKETTEYVDTEMIPIASRIDEIFKSNTISTARLGSEIDRYKASLMDAQQAQEFFRNKSTRSDYEKALINNGLSTKEAAKFAKEERAKAIAAEHSARIHLNAAEKRKEAADKIRDSEKGIFAKLNASRAKEGIRSMVGGLASMGAEMLIVAGAAKAIDYALNHEKNVIENYTQAVDGYNQKMEEIKAKQQMVSDMSNDIESKGGLVSSTGRNMGLSRQDFASVNQEIQQLKDLGPDVAMAIERNAAQLGNYSGAARIAAQSLAELKRQESATFLEDHGKDLEKNMKVWENKMAERSHWVSGKAARFNVKTGIFGENKAEANYLRQLGVLGHGKYDKSALDVFDGDYAMDNIDLLIDKQASVRAKLEEFGYSQKKIDEMYEELYDQRDALAHIIDQSAVQGMAEFTRRLSDDAIEQLGGIENLAQVQENIDGLLRNVNNGDQADDLRHFVEKIAGNGDALVQFQQEQTQLAKAMSENSVEEVNNMIKDTVEGYRKKNLVTSDEEEASLMNSMFKKYFGFSEAKYDKMVDNLKSRIKSTGLDLKKAFGVDDIGDLGANEFEKVYDFVNQLAYGLESGSKTVKRNAKEIQDALEGGLFEGIDLSTFDISRLFQFDSSELDTALATFQKIRNGASSLSNYFQDDFSSAFNQAANIISSNATNFGSTMDTLFNKIQEKTQTALTGDEYKNLIEEALDLSGLDIDEVTLPVGFSIANNDTTEDGLLSLITPNGEIIEIPVKPKVEEGSKEEVQNELEETGSGTEAPVKAKAETEEAEEELNNLEGEAEVKGKAEPGSKEEVKDDFEGIKPLVGVEYKSNNNLQEEIERTAPKNLTLPFNLKMEGGSEAEGSITDITDKIGKLAEKKIKLKVETDKSGASEAGEAAGNEYVKSAQDAVSDAKITIKDFDTDGLASAGTKAGKEFANALQKAVEGAEIDTSSITSQMKGLKDLNKKIKYKVEVDTSGIKDELKDIKGGTIKYKTEVDMSGVQNQLKDIKGKTIKYKVEVDTSGAMGAINGLGMSVSGVLSGLAGKVQGIVGQMTSVNTQAATASASLTSLSTQIMAIQIALTTMQALASQPITFSVNLSAVTTAAAKVQVSIATIKTAMQNGVAAVQAGCNAMTSAYASMTFTPPHIPLPHFSISGSFSVNPPSVPTFSVAWFKRGGIVPATNGGRVVGVAEGGEDEAIIPISKLQRYIEESMVHVLKDAMGDYKDLMEESWKVFERDYDTTTSSGYYSTKLDIPYLELDPAAEKTLNKFVNKKIDINGFDAKDIDYVLEYLTQGSSHYNKLIDDAKNMADYYEAIGDTVNKARTEVEKMALMQKQIVTYQKEADEISRQMSSLEKRRNEHYAQFLDANLELNYLYAKNLKVFGEGSDKQKEAFENAVKAYQKLAQAMKEAQDEIHKLNVEIGKSVQDLAVDVIKKNIETSYGKQEKEFQDRLDKVEREKEAYQEQIEKQEEKLKEEKEKFDDEMDEKERALDEKIETIREAQDKRDREKKLKELQDKIKEAEATLRQLENEYDTKVYTVDEEGNWQYTYQANPTDLDDALKDLEDLRNDLQEHMEDTELDRLEKEQDLLDKERENYDDHYDDMVDALEKQQEMRLDNYDLEIDMLEAHLDEIDDLRKQALDHAELMAKKWVDRLRQVFKYDMNEVLEYLYVANGDFGTQSYNPLSEIFPTEYAKQLAQSGVNLEKYTNQILQITRHPENYVNNPDVLMDAYGELKKLGTTGAVDFDEKIKMNPALAYAMKNSHTRSINDFVALQMERLGNPRDKTHGDMAGKTVSIHDMAEYFRTLGIPIDAIQISQLADKRKRGEIDIMGNSLVTPDERQDWYGSDVDFGEGGQGILKEKVWDDFMSSVLKYNGTPEAMYELTGKLITLDEKDLEIAKNVVLSLQNNKDVLEVMKEANKKHYAETKNYYTDLIGKMDATSYFQSPNGAMNEHLRYALNGVDPNTFIINQISRIGTARADGSIVTSDDIMKYFNRLGIDGRLIKNTIRETVGLEEITEENNGLVDKNTEYTGKLNLSTLRLLSGALRNISSQDNLGDILKYVPDEFRENLDFFAEQIDKFIKELEKDPDKNKEEEKFDVNGYFNGGGGSMNSHLKYALQQGGYGTDVNRFIQDQMNRTDVSQSRVTDYLHKLGINQIIIEAATGKVVGGSSGGGTSGGGGSHSGGGSQYINNDLRYALDNVNGGGYGNNVDKFVQDQLNRTDVSQDRIKKYLHNLGINGYASGGVVDYTGLAKLHGSPNSSEVVFNATDAKKLYDFIHNVDLTTLNLPRLMRTSFEGMLKTQESNTKQPMVIENITMEFPQVNNPEGVKEAILNLSRNIKMYV